MTRRLERGHLLVARVFEAPIRLYRRFLSPALPRRCKYEPSCSVYALSALRSHGIVRGLVLASWRVLRCNPFSDGGYDPVEGQRLFKRRLGGERALVASGSLNGAVPGEAGVGHRGACTDSHLRPTSWEVAPEQVRGTKVGSETGRTQRSEAQA